MIGRTALTLLLLSTATALPALAQGDPAKGETVFRRCMACHVVDREVNRVGPHLVDVFGRKAGSVEDYRYSSGLADADFVWDETNLDPWLADPRGYIPGTKMVFKVPGEQDRADLIAYLKSLSEQ